MIFKFIVGFMSYLYTKLYFKVGANLQTIDNKKGNGARICTSFYGYPVPGYPDRIYVNATVFIGCCIVQLYYLCSCDIINCNDFLLQ
jgi:hypothetical protein